MAEKKSNILLSPKWREFEMLLTDYELVKDCLNGNNEAFAELVSRYKNIIYKTVYRYINDREEANDISQEVFIKIYKSLKSYNPEYKFSTWSVRIATNFTFDVLRKKRVNSIPIEEIENVSREENTPEKRYISKERTLLIREAINSLPENYRIPIIMYHQKGLAYKEIAEQLGKPMSIIKNRIFRARLALRENLICSEI
jgi:RNA polymerase sigma factor (sigma-70 family)